MAYMLFMSVVLTAVFLVSQVFSIWPGSAPGTPLNPPREQTFRNTPIGTVIQDVTQPTLTAFFPTRGGSIHTGVVVAPGGACIALTMDVDGTNVARWLQQHGVAAFVLKYRLLPKTGEGVPKDLNEDVACRNGMADAIQAVKVVRSHSREWNIEPTRVGVLGFSAGGMVVSSALLDRNAALRPNFAGLIYGAPFGVLPTVPHNLPPVFMAWAADDPVAAQAMRRFDRALTAAQDNVETHVYPSGGHAFGLKKQQLRSDRWIDEFLAWLQIVK